MRDWNQRNRSFTSMGFLITTRTFFFLSVWGLSLFFQVSHLCPNFRKNCQTFKHHQLGKLEREIIARTFTKLCTIFVFIYLLCHKPNYILYYIFCVITLFLVFFYKNNPFFFPPGSSIFFRCRRAVISLDQWIWGPRMSIAYLAMV